jgi:hypothetical protein
MPVERQRQMADTLKELRALEREWWWLHGALNAVAQVQAGRARRPHELS